MIVSIHQQIEHIPIKEHKIHRVKEILQLVILSILHQYGFFVSHVFVGGTALRLCHGLERYSEDLDFSCKTDAIYPIYDYTAMMVYIQTELALRGFSVSIQPKTGTIAGGNISFAGLLYTLGLSGHKDQFCMIKCEIDTNPPVGGITENRVINDMTIFPLTIHTLPSLMAGKVHAILCRGFYKGRDRYDLVWYLSKKITPDMNLLTTALQQTRYPHTIHTRNDVVDLIIVTLQGTTTTDLLHDVGSFLIDVHQQSLLDTSLIQSLLDQSRQS